MGGCNLVCLLDTGCDYSMVPRRLVPDVFLAPVDFDVFTANGARVEILGRAEAQFSVQGIPVKAELLVSDDIQEFMLGHDWLTQQGAKCDFAAKTLLLKGVTVPLKTSGSPVRTRRIYARRRESGIAPVKQLDRVAHGPPVEYPTDKQPPLPAIGSSVIQNKVCRNNHTEPLSRRAAGQVKAHLKVQGSSDTTQTTQIPLTYRKRSPVFNRTIVNSMFKQNLTKSQSYHKIGAEKEFCFCFWSKNSSGAVGEKIGKGYGNYGGIS